MNEIAKRELLNWIRLLNIQSLSDMDIKLLNIIISNFDLLSSLGTASGQRAKKISELILKEKDTIPGILSINGEKDAAKIDSCERIYELEIGPFRGFTSQEHFIFDKKYTFLYGPNGSGKSSFCEGLEYALLGEISEAEAKRIPLDFYIQNVGRKISEVPIVYYIDSAGQKKNIIKNQERFRFAFIEKNRIDGFARISANTPNEQKNRIAALFGLDAFSDFVDGFTDNFQYLPTNTPKADLFKIEIEKNESEKQRLVENKKKFEEISTNVNTLIDEVGNKDIKNRDELYIFLNGTNGTGGKIEELQKQKAQQISEDIKTETIDNVSKKTIELHSDTSKLNTDIRCLYELSSDLNYKELYSAIVAIENIADSDKSICPACKTPITQTISNPFINARSEINKLKSLTELQSKIPNVAKSVERQIRELDKNIQEINEYLGVIDYDGFLSKLTEQTFTDIASIFLNLSIISNEITIVENESKKYPEIKSLIQKHNDLLNQKRKEKETSDSEIQKYHIFNNRLSELTANEKLVNDEIDRINLSLENFEKINEPMFKEIENENNQVMEYKKYINAYNNIISQLKKYRNGLPSLFAAGLSEKVRNYYNIINDHDSDFEKLENIILPSGSGEKIMIKFFSSTDSYDALHILSEGHIRVLGLSILLAKVISENIGFIIFDDIVNAIDDDHRSGIAELLMNNSDFKNRELIITCHGEMFIRILENKLGVKRTQKEVTQYYFYPTELNSVRGIKFSIGDSSHYLVQAQKHFEKNELKDVASKCRQAVESIAENLWKKIGKKMKSDLSVSMRSPNSKPDLSSLIDALKEKLKKIDNKSDIYNLFEKLKGQYMWNLLNKGTHEEDDLPEFELTDISNLLDLVKSIETNVISFDITTRIKTG
ncbi:RecF/RecN/SMC N-terminal domain protein [Treponema primitia ZAS-2]|uniref:RecF/RecN/SMC N-terminal domain protein n=1 Tax=Treponema primitia (strain ATCC BAA-887 / DSM 12427 / ZAS-2) TaxID=545694 RepID=D8L139_TREPZ|nr:DNA recombination protein RecF [Treponema primitia]ADJ19583.1 SMC domain-containing protein [Treponema primitia ZAS-2]AEF85676.1 RecF/RecN/SMC N-terminal domain protein [Treponema primitia ZAS-2]